MASSSTEKVFLPGVLFNPKKEDMVSLLRGKESGCTNDPGFEFIKDIQLYNYEPQQLRSESIDSGHQKMYFFTRLNRHKNGIIERRISTRGFWKITGSNSIEGNVAEERSFAYIRRPTERTKWLMKEYILHESELKNKEQWALCVVYYNGE